MKTSATHARNVIAMEAQNREANAPPEEDAPLQVQHKHVVVHVTEDEGWYGNKAFELARKKESENSSQENLQSKNGHAN